MTISIRCRCGKLLATEEKYRGRPVQCPFCRAAIVVPVAEATANSAGTPAAAAGSGSSADVWTAMDYLKILALIGVLLFVFKMGITPEGVRKRLLQSNDPHKNGAFSKERAEEFGRNIGRYSD
jgi:hypothetical protein